MNMMIVGTFCELWTYLWFYIGEKIPMITRVAVIFGKFFIQNKLQWEKYN